MIGSGPNGLAAAITLAESGNRVVVYEGEDSIGGGLRSAHLTLPGFVHDVCSAVHPMAVSSAFFRGLNLGRLGLRWVFPEAELAHPFDDGTAVVITRSLAETSVQFGPDAERVRRMLQPLVGHWDEVSSDILRPARIPRHPWALARFGWNAIFPAAALAKRKFAGIKARAVFAGLAAHSAMPFSAWGSAAFGTLLWTTCHAVGWPFAAGGSQSIADALALYLKQFGVEIITGKRVESLSELPESSVVLCDLTPRQFLRIGARQLSDDDRRKLQNYRYGPGAFKIDWSLDAPIPWNAPVCGKAGTVHLGGTFDEIAQSEEAAWSEAPSDKPFVLLAQPSLFDPTRAPNGKHTAWAYCHVPHASAVDMVERIERQVERFARGFRSRVIARSVMSPVDLEAHDANLIGGDISGGAISLDRLVRGSTSRAYRTPIPATFLCSASTPPGPGVHGLCGYFAAKYAHEKVLRKRKGMALPGSSSVGL
ncbi:MAG: phytoene desaturase family protein [Candidatus Acidiferrales bacterium]